MVFVPPRSGKVAQQESAFGAAETTKNFELKSELGEPGRLTRCFLVIPNFTNAVTTTITIIDGDSNTLFTSDTLARNTTHDLKTLDVVVYDTCTVTLTLSGVPGGTGGTIKTSFYTSSSPTSDSYNDITIDSVSLQLDDTDKLSTSTYGKDSVAGDTPLKVDSDGHLQVDIISGAGSGGTVDIEVGGVPPQLDDTDKLAVSLYGKESAAGDTEVLVDSSGHIQADIVSSSSDAILTTIDSDTSSLAGCVGGTELQVDVVSSSSDAILTTIDSDTSSLAGCVGGTELQVDVVSGTTDITIGSQAPQLDDTDKLAVSLYGKDSAAGDTEVLVDSSGHLQVDVLSSSSDSILTTIDSDTSSLAGCVDGTELQVDIVSGGGMASATQVAIGSDTLTSSSSHTGSAIAVSSYNELLCVLDITAITAPDSEDAWEVYLEKSFDGGTTWVHAGHFVDDQNAGDNTTTTGDPNRGRFDGNTGQFQLYLKGFLGTHIRSRATAHDENSDSDMALTFSIDATAK